MRFDEPLCETCGAPAGGIVETLLAVASIYADENNPEKFEYLGDSDVCWDSQTPFCDEDGGLIILCCSRCDNEWNARMIEE